MPPPSNVGSQLLSNAENEHLFYLLGERCVTLATAVVQLFSADPPERITWMLRCCGVACFVKDSSMRSYFIRIYDIQAGQLLFEQELYNGFKYKEVRPYLHSFEADEYQTVLNFTEDLPEEAFGFKKAIDDKLEARYRLKAAKKNSQQTPNNQHSRERPPVPPGPVTSGTEQKVNTENKSNSNKKTSLTKKDIGSPKDFQHISHVGYDNQEKMHLSIQSLDPDMKAIFTQLGYGEQVSREDYQFVTDYVSEKGGIGEFKKQLDGKQNDKLQTTTSKQARPAAKRGNRTTTKSKAPPLSATGPVSTPQSKYNKRTVTKTHAQGHPPPPPRVTSLSPKTNPPSPIGVSPTPPPMPQPSPGIKSSPAQCALPPPPPGIKSSPAQCALPPPQPPPPLSPMNSMNQGPPAPLPPPVPLNPPNASLAPQSGGRGALLEQIKQGGEPLRKIDNNDKGPTGNSRGDLLSAIRSGTTLRHIEQDKDEEKSILSSGEGEGVMGALAKALAIRQKHIQLSDEELEDDEEDDFDEDD